MPHSIIKKNVNIYVVYDLKSDLSNSECECDKACGIREYLDYKNCKCRREIICELAEECIENIDENEMIYNGTFNALPPNDYKKCAVLVHYTWHYLLYF